MTATAGDLEAYGLEEIEPGLVADTPENRRLIYKLPGDWQFERDLDEDGNPTGLIRPIPLETLTSRREYNAKIYRPLLVDPDDPWSDYVGPEEFPMDAYAPSWVLHRVAVWHRRDREGVPPEQQRPFPTRCTWIRNDGTRCWLWAGRADSDVCTPHLRHAQQDKSKMAVVAKTKLLEMTPDAVDHLEKLMLTAESEPVQLKASTEILDRAGVRGGVELDVAVEHTGRDPAEEVRERLRVMTERMLELEANQAIAAAQAGPEEIVEAEVVSDDGE